MSNEKKTTFIFFLRNPLFLSSLRENLSNPGEPRENLGRTVGETLDSRENLYDQTSSLIRIIVCFFLLFVCNRFQRFFDALQRLCSFLGGTSNAPQL